MTHLRLRGLNYLLYHRPNFASNLCFQLMFSYSIFTRSRFVLTFTSLYHSTVSRWCQCIERPSEAYKLALFHALERSDLSLAVALLDTKIVTVHSPLTSSHETSLDGMTVLMQAVKYGHPSIVEKLLKMDVDANARRSCDDCDAEKGFQAVNYRYKKG